MTDDGYPTEEALERIKTWPWADCTGLMDFIGSLWSYPDRWVKSAGRRGRPLYTVSTGGWSGNESLIEALQANAMAWRLLWLSCRRGGHYEFEPMFGEAPAEVVAAARAALGKGPAASPAGGGGT